MSTKGIIFSAPMVRALLAGTKTQTRRLCAWANNPNSPQLTYIVACDEPGWFGDEEGEVQFQAPYAPGDRLYVRESCAVDGPRVWYRLDHGEAYGRGPRVDVRWRPSIHMPRWASRLWLEVTEVRVQRLQDISEEDARAEGLEGEETTLGFNQRMPTYPHYSDFAVRFADPRESYATLWNTLHTESGQRWEDNPWIVAVSFTVQHGNIDGASAQ